MNSIYFEKQEGALCAQHALNNLLQGSYFTPVDLSTIARELDEEELRVLRQGGTNSADYLRSLQMDSQNMDDSGFFSVQVISGALRIWDLTLIPYMSSDNEFAALARQTPTVPVAYICNFREHWFTIRKFADNRWYNLNSVSSAPALVSDTYLGLLLAQLQNDGYCVFIVDGRLPACAADDALPIAFVAASDNPTNSTGHAAATNAFMDQPRERQNSSSDHDLNEALAASKRLLDDDDKTLKAALERSLMEQDEADLRAAVLMSMEQNSDVAADAGQCSSSQALSTADKANVPVDAKELREKRAAFLNRLQQTRDSSEKGHSSDAS